jgi:2-polyprenyl-6-methoxyphenol hydroxylase-like FAD-dependent oxidoreductase
MAKRQLIGRRPVGAFRALVIGGGIGGLSAALALQRAGLHANVFERSPEIIDAGGGLQIWLNGMAALDRLGIAEAVGRGGAPIESLMFRSRTGKTLVAVPIGDLARKRRALPPHYARRIALLEALGAELRDDTVRRGAQFVGFRRDSAGVAAQFADGTEEIGTILIGADGADSSVRKQLDGGDLVYAGYRYVHGYCEFDHAAAPAGQFAVTFGRGDRFGVADIGDGRRAWFAALVGSAAGAAGAGAAKLELLERFRDFPAPVTDIVAATDVSSVFRKDIYELAPSRRWGEKGITLLGDAAHALTPTLGRGAGEAIEDGIVLAECLAAADISKADAAAALRAYEQRRIGPTKVVRARASRIGKLAAISNPLGCRLRDQLMKRVVGPKMVKGFEAEILEARSHR